MPDITYPNIISAGATTSAQDVAENLFRPRTTPDNLEVVNRLDEDNLAGTPLVTRAMVRPGQYLAGGTSGHTANRDLFKEVYPGGWEVNNMAAAGAAGVAVAGICRTQHVPFVPSVVMVSWQFSAIIDDGDQWDELTQSGGYYGQRPDNRHRSSMHLYVNGVRINTANYHIGHSDRTLAQWAPNTNTATASFVSTSKAYRQDTRYMSGHFTFDTTNVGTFPAGTSPLQAGYLTVEVRVASKKRLVRVKTSNISILALR